jgi:hypothetical protein
MRQKSNTVNSLVKNKQAVTMDIEERPGRYKNKRWKCSCGAKGQWWAWPKASLVKLWEEHVERQHPEVEE